MISFLAAVIPKLRAEGGRSLRPEGHREVAVGSLFLYGRLLEFFPHRSTFHGGPQKTRKMGFLGVFGVLAKIGFFAKHYLAGQTPKTPFIPLLKGK